MHAGWRIIFPSSGLSRHSSVDADFLTYCTCKGAIEQMARVNARDLAHKGIAVNAIEPGPVDGEHFRQGKSPKANPEIIESVPTERLSKFDEIADVIVMLSSHPSRGINEQVIHANGSMA
jgi:3-oxoacyl-[acyl-carrier protein] reductase